MIQNSSLPIASSRQQPHPRHPAEAGPRARSVVGSNDSGFSYGDVVRFGQILSVFAAEADARSEGRADHVGQTEPSFGVRCRRCCSSGAWRLASADASGSEPPGSGGAPTASTRGSDEPDLTGGVSAAAVGDDDSVVPGDITVSSGGEMIVPLVPSRVLDTRSGRGAPVATVHADQQHRPPGPRPRRRPRAGVTAVAFNVTAVEPHRPSYITVWPTGAPRPDASNLNLTPGTTIPNLVIATSAPTASISLYNERGNTHLIADVVGYSTDGHRHRRPSLPRPAARHPHRHRRTRRPPSTPRPDIDLQSSAPAASPTAGVTAVAVNVTAVRPHRRQLHHRLAHRRTPTRRLQPQPHPRHHHPQPRHRHRRRRRQISLYNERGNTHLIADVVGYFTTGHQPPPPSCRPRRCSTPAPASAHPPPPSAPTSTIDLHVLGAGGVPDTGVTAVVVNVTAVRPHRRQLHHRLAHRRTPTRTPPTSTSPPAPPSPTSSSPPSAPTATSASTTNAATPTSSPTSSAGSPKGRHPARCRSPSPPCWRAPPT